MSKINNDDLFRVATTVAMILGSAVTDEDVAFLEHLNEHVGFDLEAIKDVQERTLSYRETKYPDYQDYLFEGYEYGQTYAEWKAAKKEA